MRRHQTGAPRDQVREHRRLGATNVRPGGLAGRRPVVWVFGGSTTWGVGERDNFTIPSGIARLAESAGTPIVVRNFGQIAWLNWQEMLLFEQLVATEADLPDLAVSADFWVVLYAQFMNGTPFAR